MTMYWELIKKLWLPLLLVSVLGASHYMAYAFGVRIAQAEATARASLLVRTQSEQALVLEQQARDKEQALQAAIDESTKRDQQTIAQLKAGTTAAATESGRLRDKLTSISTQLDKASKRACTAGDIEAANQTIAVLTNVQWVCSRDRQEFAGALDESTARGLSCEANYDRLKSSK